MTIAVLCFEYKALNFRIIKRLGAFLQSQKGLAGKKQQLHTPATTIVVTIQLNPEKGA